MLQYTYNIYSVEINSLQNYYNLFYKTWYFFIFAQYSKIKMKWTVSIQHVNILFVHS